MSFKSDAQRKAVMANLNNGASTRQNTSQSTLAQLKNNKKPKNVSKGFVLRNRKGQIIETHETLDGINRLKRINEFVGGTGLTIEKRNKNTDKKAKYITLLNRASRVTFQSEYRDLGTIASKRLIMQGVDRMLANDTSQGGYGGKFKRYILKGGKLPQEIK